MASKLGSVINLYITKENDTKRVSCDTIQLDKGGVISDKFFQKKEKREVLLTSTKSYQFAKNNNHPLNESDLGENILVDFDIKSLQIGDRLEIGSSIVEISMECPICNHLSKIDKKLPKLIKDERGIFAKVIQKGSLQTNDTIYKI